MGCASSTTAVEPFVPPVADAEAAALRWPLRCQQHSASEGSLVRCTEQTLAKRGAPVPVIDCTSSFIRASLHVRELREKIERASQSAPAGIGVAEIEDGGKRLETAIAFLDAARDGMRQNMDTPRRKHCNACIMAVAKGVWPSPRWCAKCNPDGVMLPTMIEGSPRPCE